LYNLDEKGVPRYMTPKNRILASYIFASPRVLTTRTEKWI